MVVRWMPNLLCKRCFISLITVTLDVRLVSSIVACALKKNRLCHVNGTATAFLHTDTAFITQGLINHDLPAQRFVLIFDVGNRTSWTGRDGLAQLILSGAFAFINDWFHGSLLKTHQNQRIVLLLR
jgi:hypothetical protein